MLFKTPEFWTKKNPISILLYPLSLIYCVGFFVVKFLTKTTKVSKPVICVGNLIAGGSGKTPTAIALGKILQENFGDFAFLSRGYMSDGAKFLLLNRGDKNKARQVGDEPILLSETAPTFVAHNRLFGAKQIEIMNKFKMIVLDDGMQNDSLYRDFTIMVVDGKIGFGNGFMIPAGPMREPLNVGLKKANLVVVIGEANECLMKKLLEKKVVRAKICPINIDNFLGKKLIAFCGLAYPQKFFSFLKRNGLELDEEISFADHYDYRDEDLTELSRLAERKSATLVTTKKDWVKFSSDFQKKISYLDIEIEFENKNIVIDELKKFL